MLKFYLDGQSTTLMAYALIICQHRNWRDFSAAIFLPLVVGREQIFTPFQVALSGCMFIFFWELNIFHDDVLMFKTAFGDNDTGDNDIGDGDDDIGEGDGDGDDDMGNICN